MVVSDCPLRRIGVLASQLRGVERAPALIHATTTATDAGAGVAVGDSGARVPIVPVTVDAPKGFAEDPISFMRAQRKEHVDAFTLRRSANTQYVVINDPLMVEMVLDDVVTFGNPITPNMSVNKNVFGISAEVLETHEDDVVKRLRGFLIKNKDGLATRIADKMKSYLAQRIGDGAVMDLRDLGEAIFWPMTQALFGDHSIEKVEPGLYKAFETIDGLFGKALQGRALPEVRASVDLAAQHFKASITGVSGCPMGPALKFYNDQVGVANGGNADAAARFATAAWWGGLGNTWPSTVWTFGMLLADPRCRRMAYEEVDREFHDQPDANGNYDFSRLKFLTSALSEVLRLKTYSIAWRVVQKDIVLEAESGNCYLLSKGTTVAVPWCVQHYDENIWSQPYEFRPERHLPGMEEQKGKGLSAVRERMALSPFSWGPHKCSGYPLAMVEIPAALAVVFQAYDMELLDDLPGHDWKTAFGVVGPDTQPTRVRMRRRNGASVSAVSVAS